MDGHLKVKMGERESIWIKSHEEQINHESPCSSPIIMYCTLSASYLVILEYSAEIFLKVKRAQTVGGVFWFPINPRFNHFMRDSILN